MPQHESSIALAGMATDTALALAYQTFQELNWQVQYAGDVALAAITDTGWKKGQQIICRVEDDTLHIKSEMIHNELADALGKNKKNTGKFTERFNALAASGQLTNTEAIHTELAALRESTLLKVAEEEKEAIEIDQAMNLSGSNLYVTYGIIALNLLVFVLMCLDGAGIFDANGLVHLKWGSNYGPLTLSGDWWRLVTNIFIHFGIIHVAMNMYSLYTVGVYLEPMLGKWRYAAAYLCTGILASIVSLWWHKNPVNSAGASGAVFGMFGVFFALLTSNLIPNKIRKALLQNIGIFIGYNLLYGLKGGIDNAAHIGGLLSGFVFGYAYVSGIRKDKAGSPARWIVPAIIVITLAASYSYLHQNKKPVAERTAILGELNAASFKDNDKFNDKLNEFDKMHARVDAAIGDTTLNYEQLAAAIDKTALPEFTMASQMLQSTSSYDISPTAHQKASLLVAYLQLKKEEMLLLKRICQGEPADTLMPQLNEIRSKTSDTYQQVLKL